MADIISHLRDRASRAPRRIVFPESTDPRVLQAAARMVQLKMARPLLVGSPAATQKKASELGINLASIEIIDSGSRAFIER